MRIHGAYHIAYPYFICFRRFRMNLGTFRVFIQETLRWWLRRFFGLRWIIWFDRARTSNWERKMSYTELIQVVKVERFQWNERPSCTHATSKVDQCCVQLVSSKLVLFSLLTFPTKTNQNQWNPSISRRFFVFFCMTWCRWYPLSSIHFELCYSWHLCTPSPPSCILFKKCMQ